MAVQPVQRRLQFVVEQYDIPPVVDVSLSFFGMANEVFIITTEKGKYVLKNCLKRDTKALVENELALIEHLNNHQCPTPEIVPAKDGKPYVELSGGFYVMTRFIDQRTITWNEPNKRRFFPEVIRALASFHKATDGFAEPNPNLQMSVLDIDAYLTWLAELEVNLHATKTSEPQRNCVDGMLQVVPRLRALALDLQIQIQSVDIAQLSKGYIHGDMHSFNLFYDEREQYTYMVDFDFARVDHRMFDVYWTSQILFYQQLTHRYSHDELESEGWRESEEVAIEILEENWSSILRYYRDVATLSDAELRLVGLFVLASPLYISRFFDLDNSDQECAGHVGWFERELDLAKPRAAMISKVVSRLLDNERAARVVSEHVK